MAQLYSEHTVNTTVNYYYLYSGPLTLVDFIIACV